MFTYFNGTVEELLNRNDAMPESEVKRIGDKDALLNREELIATVMDEYKLSREEAERIVTEIQLEEFERIAKGMVEKGLLEIGSYDGEGQPVYVPTQKGLELLG